MSYFNYNRVRHIDDETVRVSANTVPSVVALSHIQGRTYENLELLRLHAASTSQAEMDRYEAEIIANRALNTKDLKTYEGSPFAPGEEALYEKVKQDRITYYDLVDQIKKVSRSADPASNAVAAQMIDTQLLPVATRLCESIQAVVDLNNSGSTTGLQRVREAVSATIRGTVIGLLLSIALAALITVLIVRSIVRPLAKAVAALGLVAEGDLTASLDVDTRDEIGDMAKALNQAVERLNSTMRDVADNAANASSSSQQLAAASEAIASGAQEQAASLEETSASLEEITATVRQSSDNAQQASQLAVSSRDAAVQGQEVVAQAITAMSEINTSSAKISEIISTIEEIAFQTNLLAVNAAVEAARAGDEGRGFAVVASEVRALAQRSAGAAKEIKGLIQDSLHKVHHGSALVNRSGETLQGIVASVKRVTDIVSEMATAASEQSAGVEQVNTAMTQMDHVTQSNSAQTEELSATAESLSEQASKLLELVGAFNLGNGGKNQRNGQSASRPAEVRQPAKAFKSKALAKAGSFAHARKATSHPQVAALAVNASSGSSDASFEEF
jgi:methyl-accepting chemotaxis protein